MKKNFAHQIAVLVAVALMPGVGTAAAAEDWNFHGQFTNVTQWHPAFDSPYRGSNSLDSGNYGRETADVTLFVGARLWGGATAYVNPEIDQGFGLDGTLGIAGFPSGEAYKVGARNPYFRLPRAFVRQTIELDGKGAPATLVDSANQLAGSLSADNLIITVGKFSVVDIFDTNQYAHDPRADFMNWSVVDGGAFDYPADAWGFTYGAAVEWTHAWWTLRGGAFALSKIPNTKDIDGRFQQFGIIAEFEERHQCYGLAGKVKALAFLNRGRMGSYADAVALGERTNSSPDTALVRHYASRPGLVLNLEQAIGEDAGVFSRASYNTGSMEAFEFTEIDKSLAVGTSMHGTRWGRGDDVVGIADVWNGISNDARRYFDAGGMGILIGDGRLPNYGLERILETYYAARVAGAVTVSADYQFVRNPAYNRDRGPVSIFGLRLHAEF